jgi:hypothetical protein
MKDENADRIEGKAECVLTAVTLQSHGSSGHALHLLFSYITDDNLYRM